MLNQCNFIGRAANAPDIRYTAAGEAVASVSIAVSETWKDKSGQKQEKTEWVNVVFWKKLAEISAELINKGSLIYVSGRMQTRKWKDKDERDRYTTEIVAEKMLLLGGKGERREDVEPERSSGFDDDPLPF